MQAQLAVVVGLHVCNHNQTTAPIYSPPETSSLVPATKAQDTERLSSTEKHFQDINIEKTASQKVVKNSHTDDIVQVFTEHGTPVEAIDTQTMLCQARSGAETTPMYQTGHPNIVSLMPRPVLFMQGACFLFFLFLPEDLKIACSCHTNSFIFILVTNQVPSLVTYLSDTCVQPCKPTMQHM